MVKRFYGCIPKHTKKTESKVLLLLVCLVEDIHYKKYQKKDF